MTLTPVAVRVTVELLLPSLYGTLLKSGGVTPVLLQFRTWLVFTHFLNISLDVNLSTNI